MNFTPDSYGSALNEANDCHEPAGSSKGGQFCSKDGPTAAPAARRGRRAEFEGECQLCGHQQMLPAGVLSQHGYAVKWNMFVGVCPGSRCKPFEQSTDKIEEAIDQHLRQAERLRTEAHKLRQLPPEGETTAWAHVYYPAQGMDRRGGYRWVKVNVEEVHRDVHGSRYIDYLTTVANGPDPRRGERDRRMDFGYGQDQPKTLPDAIRAMNSRYAVTLDATATNHEQYAQWQRQRIAGWQPRPLRTRREAPVTAPANVRYRRGQRIWIPALSSERTYEVAGFHQGTVTIRLNGEWKRFKADEVRKA